jgi:hypothetical protein
MRSKRPRRSVMSLTVLVVALGIVSSSAYGSVRIGKFQDTDTTLGDGNFGLAKGVARCKRGERLTGGGVRRVSSDGLFPGVRWILQESGPVPANREYVATALSDLGGLGRKDFRVVALCQPRRR